MLQGFRKLSQGWLGKIIVTILFGFLIVSFAIWGVNDIFRGSPRTTVATVGQTDISAEAVRNAYQTEVQRISRQSRRSITPDQARALGLDRQILSRLVTERLLDAKAQDLKLGVSDQTVAKGILEDPNFRGSNGRFDRATFDDLLRSNSYTEEAYVREQRAVMTRLQLAEALTADLPVPSAAKEAIHRYSTERRSATYFALPATAAGEIPAPSDEELQTFFEGRRGLFRAPETRAVSVMVLQPDALARAEDVSDEDARQRYERAKDAKYGSPERRTIQRIDFPSIEEAQAALDRIKGGQATFDAIAQERGTKELEMGTFSKPELFDKPVADAAFALDEGAVSGPVRGQFGTVLVRVTKVEPGTVKPYEAVEGDIKREIALERSKQQLTEVHDTVEDLRAGAKPLADIAREKKLPLLTVPAIDREGKDKAGRPVEGIPDRDAVVAAVFASDVGVDNEAVRTAAGGYVWFDVTGIEPARDKPLAEVRDAVIAQWRTEEAGKRLAQRAREFVERLDKGEAIEDVAKDAGVEIKTAADLARNTGKDELGAEVVNRIFAVPVGKAGSAANGEAARVVFKVVSATVPPLAAGNAQAQTEDRLRVLMSDDLLGEYIAELQKEIGVRVYESALQRAIGGGGEY
jgi:peptidyl-prolyl cis-trans isomerase D